MAVKTKSKAKQDNELVNDGDKVWVTISRTVQVGNYEPYRLEAGYSQTLKNDENPMEKIAEIEEELSEFVNKKARIKKKKRVRRQQNEL